MRIIKMLKSKKGLTLMEAVIALFIWLILSSGVIFVWQHSARSSMEILRSQNAFENARVAMDAIIMNIQMAREIELTNNPDGVMRRLILTSRDPQGLLHNYRFYFDIDAAEGEAKFQRLEFGTNNEFASDIALIRLEFVQDNRFLIEVVTGCNDPIVLNGSVDARYKVVRTLP